VGGVKIDLQITFLGTAAERILPIKNCDCPQCKEAEKLGEDYYHRFNSSLLIEENGKKIVIDVGKIGYINDVQPDYVLITHAHPDHTSNVNLLDPGVPIFLTVTTRNKADKYFKAGRYFKIIKPNIPFRVGGVKFVAHRVYHSTIAPTVCFKIADKILYAPDCFKFYNEKILNGVEYYICDGSSLERDIERPGNVGHLSIKNSIALAKKYKVKYVIATHIGHIRLTEKDLEERVSEMVREAGFPQVKIAKDGMKLEEFKEKSDKNQIPSWQRQKINSPTFAYWTVYNEYPKQFLRGRTDFPKRTWCYKIEDGKAMTVKKFDSFMDKIKCIEVDKEFRDKWLEDLNSISEVEIRSSDIGHSYPDRPAFVVFRFKDQANDKKAEELVARLKKEKGLYVATDIGMENRPRICVAGKVWYAKDKEEWEKWWDSVAEKIERCVEEVLKENLEEFKLKDYNVKKVRDDQLRDDFRLVLGKISVMMDGGKTEFKSLDDAKEFLKKVVKELLRRKCITFHPEEMKPRSLQVLKEVLKKLEKEGIELSDEVKKIIEFNEMVKPTEPEPEFVYLKDVEKVEPDRIVLSDPLSSWTGKMASQGKGHDADLHIGGNVLSNRGMWAFIDRLNEKIYPVTKKLIDPILDKGTPYNTYIPNYRLVAEKIPLSERKKVVMEEKVKDIKEIKLDLGCGENKPEGYFGIDKQSFPGVDLVWDLENGIPFNSDSVDEIRAYHFLEHMSNPIMIMNEIWRVLRPGGILEFEVPSTKGEGAVADPSHRSQWNKLSFQFYVDDTLRRTHSIYCKFKILELEEFENKDWETVYVRGKLQAIKDVSKKGIIQTEIEESVKTLKPLVKFTPLKTGKGYVLGEYFSIEDMWDKWAKGYIDRGMKIDLEEKLNGYRTVFERDEAGRTLIYFEDTKEDKSHIFPEIVGDLKIIGEGVILDGDIGAIGIDGRVLPRKELAFLTSRKKPIEGEFENPAGTKGKLRVTIFDLLYWKGEDLHTKPWIERRKRLEELFGKFDFRILKLIDKHIVDSKDEFVRVGKKLSKLDGSEGFVAKIVSSDYPLTGESPSWAKLKLALEIKVQVLKKFDVKDGGYNYEIGYLVGNKIVSAGKTYNTKINAKVGDILTLTVQEVIPKEKDGKWYVNFVVPGVVDLETQRRRPETAREIIRRADKAGILQVTREIRDKLKKDKIIESSNLDWQNKCTIEEAQDDEGKVGEFGNIDFKEGMSGEGVCFPGETLIFNNPQPTAIIDIKPNAKILNSKGNYQKVNKTFIRKYSGDLVELKPWHLLPISITPEHPVLIQRLKKCRWNDKARCRPNCVYRGVPPNYCTDIYKPNIQWIEAKMINPDTDYVCIPRPNNFKELNELEIPIEKLRGIDYGDYWKTSKYSNQKYPKRIKIDEELMELIGWYLAEGCRAGEDKIQFSLGIEEKKEVKRIRDLLWSKFGIKSGVLIKPNPKNVIEVRGYSKFLGLLFEYLCNRGATNKKIPDFIFDLNPKLIQIFLRSYLAGDGYKFKNREKFQITTSSKTIANQFILLGAKLGYLPAIQYYKYPKRRGGFYSITIEGKGVEKLLGLENQNRYVQTLTFEDDYGIWIPITKKRIKKFDGFVYNLETEDNTYAVPFIVHNCQLHIMGLTEDGMKKIKKNSKRIIQARNKGIKEFSKVMNSIIQAGAHIDIRMQPNGANWWEGGEIFIGNIKGLEKLANYKVGQSLRMQFKQSRVGEKKTSIIKGPLIWMDFGKDKPMIFNPGEVGAFPNTYAAMIIMDTFKWIAGFQKEHAKEFKFDFDINNQWDGRWIMGFVPVTGKGKKGPRVWMMRMTKQKELDSEKKSISHFFNNFIF